MSEPIKALLPEQIYFRIHGDPSAAPPLALLHGLLGFSANWGKVWPGFSQNRQVLVFDQRGHGRTQKPDHGYTPEHYAADLLNLLDHLGWKRVHLLGHSMGGRVAMHFAKAHPDRLASLILEDSGAEARPDRIPWIKKILSSAPTPFADREAAKQYFNAAYRADPATGAFLQANLATDAAGRLHWRFHPGGMIETIETGRATTAMPIFCGLKIPTQIIRGGQSIEFSQEEAMRMQQCRPETTKLTVIENAGHLVHAEKPQEFSAAVQSFISSVEHNLH